jgi:hypothetical protein
MTTYLSNSYKYIFLFTDKNATIKTMADPGTLEWWMLNIPPMTEANIALLRVPPPIVQRLGSLVEEHRAVTRQFQTATQRSIYEREVRDHAPAPE